MVEQHLFQIRTEEPYIEVFLGVHACDIPFEGGLTQKAGLSLTTDSPRSKNGIPVLRLLGINRTDRPLDFESHEQTPAGHAAKLVADWLNRQVVSDEVRYAAELFLWQWPGIQQHEDGQWQLADEDDRRTRFSGVMVDCSGKTIAHDAGTSDLPREQILQSPNLRVNPLGYCRKLQPCYLLDACFLCPHFMCNASFLPALRERVCELRNKRADASACNNQRLAETSLMTLHNIGRIEAALTHDRTDPGEAA